MIGVDRRSFVAPASLQMQGAKHLIDIRAHVAAGTLVSSLFKTSIYASAELKEVLWTIQHAKCCFCERPGERGFWTVEHFRPKTRADRGNGTVDVGYWWLAYDFSNLYFACPNCNTPKSDKFPLAPGTGPLAPEQHPQMHTESPMLVDPVRDDPEQHLTFVRIPRRGFHIAPRTARGKATIEAFRLDRDDLHSLRQKHYERYIEPLIGQFHEANRAGDAISVERLRKLARPLSHSDSPFALLARVAFRAASVL